MKSDKVIISPVGDVLDTIVTFVQSPCPSPDGLSIFDPVGIAELIVLGFRAIGLFSLIS